MPKRGSIHRYLISALTVATVGLSVAASAKAQEAEATAPTTAECMAFKQDADADLGEVLKASCKPTLAQMSALMDNSLGNVAMWINQYDYYNLTNELNGKSGDKHNYMGILQFPKGLNENWNLINRFVYNVPSMPLDQDKFDDRFANFGAAPGGGGGITPPSSPPPAAIDIFGGRAPPALVTCTTSVSWPRRSPSNSRAVPICFGAPAWTWDFRPRARTS